MGSPDSLIAPLRFGVVQPNLYRGSYPHQQNVRFLERLQLKTIISLTPQPLEQPELLEYARRNNVQLIHIECASSKSASKKKRGVPLGYEIVQRVVEYMINADYAPMYVHCLNGSQVTGLAVACLRKLSFWSLASIEDEFLRYSDIDVADQLFIEKFHAQINLAKHLVPWVWKGLSRTGVVRNHPTLKILTPPTTSPAVTPLGSPTQAK